MTVINVLEKEALKLKMEFQNATTCVHHISLRFNQKLSKVEELQIKSINHELFIKFP
jgi:hypothetical protein